MVVFLFWDIDDKHNNRWLVARTRIDRVPGMPYSLYHLGVFITIKGREESEKRRKEDQPNKNKIKNNLIEGYICNIESSPIRYNYIGLISAVILSSIASKSDVKQGSYLLFRLVESGSLFSLRTLLRYLMG